jgi:uncharacterized protein (DUF2252 family)
MTTATAEAPQKTGRPARGAVPSPRGSAPSLSPAERAQRGKTARAAVPREAHAEFELRADRADPVALLEEQARPRLPDLVPVRWGRMAASPFAYYRGAALPMAHDLAGAPVSGLTVQACGDAHLSNFGAFGSPERRLLFDINDFDETLPGPWEWDVKRLAASLEVAARDNGFGKKQRDQIVMSSATSYRQAMRQFAVMTNLDIWYARADVEDLRQQFAGQVKGGQRKQLDKNIAKARTRDSMQALSKLTTTVNGQPRITADPPLIIPASDLVPDDAERSEIIKRLSRLMSSFKRTLQNDRKALLDQYAMVDLARKVVGVGSVGTRCWIILMLGRDASDPLFLQVKEAEESVLARYAGASAFDNQGHRVVAGQRLMQASSDIFLGWQRNPAGIDDDQPHDFYVRQLRDWKFSLDIATMNPRGMRQYAELCGWTLARAHARSGDRIAIAAYLGGSDVFDRAIAEFAIAYADQNERDYNGLLHAIRTGRVQAERGV